MTPAPPLTEGGGDKQDIQTERTWVMATATAIALAAARREG